MPRDVRPDLSTAWSADLPAAFGLYDPANEHDACGVSFVVDMQGRASHDIVAMGVGALCNLEHRGAPGAEANTGDGAGILIQMPDRFLRAVVDFDLPARRPLRRRASRSCPPTPSRRRRRSTPSSRRSSASEGLEVLGWRDVPIDDSMIGAAARAVDARCSASCSSAAADGTDRPASSLERRAFVVRKRIEHEVRGT